VAKLQTHTHTKAPREKRKVKVAKKEAYAMGTGQAALG